MRKILLVLILFVNPAHAIKLCGRTCTWSSGTISTTKKCEDASGGGVDCKCTSTITISSCSISTSWVKQHYYEPFGCQGSSCQSASAQCTSGCGSCSNASSGGSSSDRNPTAVTCPANGTCTDANFKTVNDGESCGSGYSERTSPALTITGTYSNDAGTFTYTNCH